MSRLCQWAGPPLVALGVLAAAPDTAGAAFPGVNGRISLTQRVPAGPDGRPRANRDIVAYGRDGGTSRQRVTTSIDNEEQSSWSPDGRWVAYKRRDAVWVSRWDGTGVTALTETVVTDDSYNTQPSWTPDGRSIVFRSNRERAPATVGDIWIMDAETGGHQRPLLRRPGDERYASFSPDGTRLLFRGDADGVDRTGDEEIYVADADGTDAVAVTSDGVYDSAPAWSPDGARIAFQSHRDGADLELYVMDADGTNIVRLTDNDVHDEGAAWSPDGRLIAFTRADARDAPGDVWTMLADGSQAAPLTSTPIIEESPDWQPLPVAVGDPELPRVACGDLSLVPGGVASVLTVKGPCEDALRVAEDWQAGAAFGAPPERIRGYDCAAAEHSFDQVVVQCDHRGSRKGVAFVHRAVERGS